MKLMKTQLDIVRAMTPGERISAAMRLYWTARRVKEAALRAKHPKWTDAEIRRAVNESFLYARD